MIPQDPDSAASTAPQTQASGLSRLLHLSQQMRRSETVEELLFLVMNETRQVIGYDEAFLFFDADGHSPVLQCISGLATFERETPKIAWLEKNIARLRNLGSSPQEPVIIQPDNLPEEDAESWHEFMSPEAIIVPFRALKARQSGFLLFARAQPWSDKDARLLTEIADNFSYSYSSHQLKAGISLLQYFQTRKSKIWLGAGLVAAIVMFWPVHEVLVAEMEVTPIAPWIATAPIEGVIRKINVEPNAPVQLGAQLFEMDDTTLRNEVILANERLEIARQELRQARQQVVTRGPDDKKADAALLSLEVRKKENEARYNQELLQKTKMLAGASGVPVFSSPSEIEGRPVHTGESIMVIADPDRVELTITMPANDAIIIKPGDAVVAYLHAAPFDPLKAKVRYVSYKAQRTDIADQFAYKIKADLIDTKAKPRLGLKGTARVKGERTTLFYVLFRKPLGYVRRMVGI